MKCSGRLMNQTTRLETVNDDVSAPTDINTRGVCTSADTSARGVGTSISTTQEALERKVLRLAPERKSGMLSKHLLDRWS